MQGTKLDRAKFDLMCDELKTGLLNSAKWHQASHFDSVMNNPATDKNFRITIYEAERIIAQSIDKEANMAVRFTEEDMNSIKDSKNQAINEFSKLFHPADRLPIQQIVHLVDKYFVI